MSKRLRVATGGLWVKAAVRYLSSRGRVDTHIGSIKGNSRYGTKGQKENKKVYLIHLALEKRNLRAK